MAISYGIYGELNSVNEFMNPTLFQTTDWNSIPAREYSGETGKAFWRTVEYDNLQMKMVEYSADYRSGEWLAKGFIIFCIEGKLTAELRDGTVVTLTQGMTFQIPAHASIRHAVSEKGARLLIIDGDFVKERKQTHFNPWRM